MGKTRRGGDGSPGRQVADRVAGMLRVRAAGFEGDSVRFEGLARESGQAGVRARFAEQAAVARGVARVLREVAAAAREDLS